MSTTSVQCACWSEPTSRLKVAWPVTRSIPTSGPNHATVCSTPRRCAEALAPAPAPSVKLWRFRPSFTLGAGDPSDHGERRHFRADPQGSGELATDIIVEHHMPGDNIDVSLGTLQRVVHELRTGAGRLEQIGND